jgi:hypothetical protein
MVQILRRGPVAVFRIFDGDGRAIGEVVQPKSPRVVGRGASTVLLVRVPPLVAPQDSLLRVQQL